MSPVATRLSQLEAHRFQDPTPAALYQIGIYHKSYHMRGWRSTVSVVRLHTSDIELNSSRFCVFPHWRHHAKLSRAARIMHLSIASYSISGISWEETFCITSSSGWIHRGWGMLEKVFFHSPFLPDSPVRVTKAVVAGATIMPSKKFHSSFYRSKREMLSVSGPLPPCRLISAAVFVLCGWVFSMGFSDET